MKQKRNSGKRLILSLMLVMCAIGHMYAGDTYTYYSKVTAKAKPTGLGTVYVGTGTTAGTYETVSEATQKGESTSNSTPLTYYLFAKAAEGCEFNGWYSNEACTEVATDVEPVDGQDYYKVTITATSKEADNPTQKIFYAKFVNPSLSYSSSVTATAVGEGQVSVATTSGAEDYGTQKSASILNDDEPLQTYYLSAITETQRFMGWYSNEACTSLISLSPTFAYKVSDLSTDGTPKEFLVYAKFANDAYQLMNNGYEVWEGVAFGDTKGDEPVAWSSFLTMTGTWASTAAANQVEKNTASHSGSYSARIYTNTVVGVVAQGNLTTGCINGGSTSASDGANNYNYTNENVEGQAMYFTGRPDAMRVWLKGNTKETVKISAYLHEKGYYQDPNDKNTGKLVRLIAKAAGTPNITADWAPYTVNFNYASENRPYYALISFATCSTPGGGDASDYMYIDDVEMIYNSELAKATYNGEEIVFEDRKGTVDALYDEEKLALTSNGVAANIETSFDEAEAVLTVTVKGDNISEDPTNQHIYTIQFKKYLKGDANGDGKVTITDAVAVVNYILNTTQAKFIKSAADIDSNGEITITDAVGIVNIILNSSSEPAAVKERRATETSTEKDPE